jgi:hypothetical protein
MVINFYSCSNDSNSALEFVEVDPMIDAQLLFSSIEYNLYMGKRQKASLQATTLLKSISDNTKVSTTKNLKIYKDLLNNIASYSSQIKHKSEHWSLEELRDLKGQFIMMENKDDYNPFLFNLWKYEEAMYYTTKAAIDPMLDLYEWGEFQPLVTCMNQEWKSVISHYPALELFDSNRLSYKIQTLAKIRLQKTMDNFNIAVNSDDYINYDLCDYGFALRESYVQYLKTIVDQQSELEPHLAIF